MNDVKRGQTAGPDAHVGQTVGAMLAFLVVGIPIVLFDWQVLDDALVGRFHLRAIAIAVVLAIIFLVWAWVLGRRMRALLVSHT